MANTPMDVRIEAEVNDFISVMDVQLDQWQLLYLKAMLRLIWSQGEAEGWKSARFAYSPESNFERDRRAGKVG
jgi:hypothetical protein